MRSFVTVVLVLGLMTGGLCRPVASASQIAQQAEAFTISPVVKRGDPTADGGTFFDCDFCDVRIAGDHGLNDLGEVVISGLRVGTCGIGVYVVSGRTGFRVADNCHQSPFGPLSLFAGDNINNRGEVALNTGPNVNNTIIDMILLYSDGQLKKIAAEGDQSPLGTILGGSCGFGPPSINNHGDVAFFACSNPDEQGAVYNGVLAYSGGKLRKVVKSGDPSPLGGQISLAFGNAGPVHINDKGDVLFWAGQFGPEPIVFEPFGLFLSMADGTVRKIELGRDVMPNGSKAADNSLGLGYLNNKGDVVYNLLLSGKPRAGIFEYSDGKTSTIVLDGDPTPVGGMFDRQTGRDDVVDFTTKINDNGTVAFISNITDGSSPEAVFLASPKAIVKVIGIGDRLPTGEKIRGITSFALNNVGQVAFFANGSDSFLNPEPLGVFLATPNPPEITSIKLKQKKGSLQLRVNGSAMITNDTLIEINGVPLDSMDYPADFREVGGTTTQVISRDLRLQQMFQSGQPVQVTVFNSLTNLRSAPMTFVR